MNCFPVIYWLKRPQRHQKTTQGIAVALSCPLELDDRILSLKTAQALVAGHREINRELIREFSLLAAMHSAGNTMPAVGGEETAMVLSSAEPSMLQY